METTASARRWRAVALLAAGLALGATMTASPVAAHVGDTLPHLVTHLKKTFYTKSAANQRFYAKGQADARFAKVGDAYTKAEVDTKLGTVYTKAEVDGKITPLDSELATDLTIGIGNGVGNNLGCAAGTLAVEIVNARRQPRDHRFTFQVPHTALTFGQIRSDGSIRNSSANVTGVSHTADSGIYCIAFSAAISQAALESAVVSIHAEGQG